MSLRLNRSALGTYSWARLQMSTFFIGTDKEVLIKQVEELKTQLQSAKKHISSQEQTVTQLSIRRTELETLDGSYREKHKNDIFQQQLEKERKTHAEGVSEYQEQTQRLKAEEDTLHQQLEQEIKLLQQDTSERERDAGNTGGQGL
ncbi:interaptin-like [Scomber scombrus]|uniref:Interaptin-like n=1 Tax=Scomber scombrus TaxID=13677 RepID=A0AAV1PSX2_SCOSC